MRLPRASRRIPEAAFALLTIAFSTITALAACDSDPDPAPAPLWPADWATAMPEVRDCRFSIEHDGHFIRVHANAEAAQAYTDGVYPFPPGTLLVKGEYDDAACTELSRVSTMLKLDPGTDPDLGDWAWQRTDGTGKDLTDGGELGCLSCHKATCPERDLACTDP